MASSSDPLDIVKMVLEDNPLPMLLNPSREVPDTYNLYSTIDNKTYDNFYAPGISNTWIVGSMRGWLVTVDIEGKDINLFNPLTQKQICLPPLCTIPKPSNPEIVGGNDKFWFVRKVLLFSDPEEDPDNCIIVALVSTTYSIRYCRIGDNEWKKIEKIAPGGVTDIIRCNNVLCAITFQGSLFSVDLTDSTKVTLVAQYDKCRFQPGWHHSLMELSGEPLILVRHFNSSGYTSKFKVYKLKEVPAYPDYYRTEQGTKHDVDGIQYILHEVKNIGDQIVFVGYNNTMWLDSKQYPGCKGNCIYFADYQTDCDICRVTNSWYGHTPMNHDVGIYHIDEDRIETFSGFKPCLRGQTVWFSPTKE